MAIKTSNTEAYYDIYGKMIILTDKKQARFSNYTEPGLFRSLYKYNDNSIAFPHFPCCQII